MEVQKRKILYPVSPHLRDYLHRYGRAAQLPLTYPQLMECHESMPVYDKQGNDTLWETFVYEPVRWAEIERALAQTYAHLKAPGNLSIADQLRADRVDFCTFGNTRPFRIRIVNKYNDNHDYMYIKRTDASRIYGLELEELLSPNSINFLVHENTLIEEHIVGVPGDQFIVDYFQRDDLNKVRIAKEFVKFNERCFLRLLGDMRSYNYVVRMTPDFDDRQYRVRAIDFDQQSYEGRHRFYLPQFFKDNKPVVELCLSHLNPESVQQYRNEEQALIARRASMAPYRLNALKAAMCRDAIAPAEKVAQLATELADYNRHTPFSRCQSMGEIVFAHIEFFLAKANGGKT